MQTSTNEVIILWASYFDELAAVTFAYEFRQMGMPATLVAIHNSEEQRCSDILTHSKQGLHQTLAAAERITCLVIPTSSTALAQFEQDPQLWQLIQMVHENGGRIVMARPNGATDPEIARKLPPSREIMRYPTVEKLLLFARWLAHSLVVGDGLNADRPTGVVPPLVRVAAHSDPTGVAGAIAGIVRDYGFAEAQAVGPSAMGQMMKAAAIAKSYLAADKLSLFAKPDFVNVRIGGQPRSAIRLFISAWPVGMDNWIDWEQAKTFVDADED